MTQISTVAHCRNTLICQNLETIVEYSVKIGERGITIEPSDWASEASPSLGCSIEISRDICMSVCPKETHTKNTYGKNTWESKVARNAHKQRGNFLCISELQLRGRNGIANGAM